MPRRVQNSRAPSTNDASVRLYLSISGRLTVISAMHDLTLQIGQIDYIVVADRQRADAGGRQIQRNRRAQTAGTDDQHIALTRDLHRRVEVCRRIAAVHHLVHARLLGSRLHPEITLDLR